MNIIRVKTNAQRMVTAVVTFTILFLFPASGFTEEPFPVYSNNPVVATVDGEPIWFDDLKTYKIQEILKQLYDLQVNTLRQKIIDKLRKNHTELRKLQMPKATKKDIERFYAETPGIKELGSLEKMENEIRQYLDQMFKNSYYETQYEVAVKKGWVVNYLEPPNEFHVVAKLGTAATWFDDKEKNRMVYVLEYSDFQCPFCKRVQGTLKKLRARYSKQVQFGYRHFPIASHKEASYLAEAAECAREQGKFWEMQSAFYAVAPAVVPKDDMKKFAQQVGVANLDRFDTCMKLGKYKDRVRTDVQEALKIGVQGTPTFIMGVYNSKNGSVVGEMFSGAVSESVFVKKLEKYLTLAESQTGLSTAAATP